MHSSKLIEIIKVLDKEELKQLNLFLQSPYFVSDKEGKYTRPLFEYIHSFYPDFSSTDLTKAKTYNTLFPGEQYIRGKLEKIMTLLLQAIQRFVVQYHTDKQNRTIQDALTLARFYRQKKRRPAMRAATVQNLTVHSIRATIPAQN